MTNNLLKEALLLYRENIEKFPHDVVARNGLANTLRDMGHLQEALNVLSETIEMFPGDILSRHGYAETLKAMGRLEEALEAQQSIFVEFPLDIVSQLSLADTYLRLGKYITSITLYKEVLDKEPNNAVARNGCAEGIRLFALQDMEDEKIPNYKYKIALSFAGEDRIIAAKFARLLSDQGISVFYDEFEQANLWGKDLYQHFAEIYSNNAQYCVVLISKHYANKLWTKHELKQAQERAFKENREYILPVRLDETPIPGVTETTGYIDLQKVSVEYVVKLLIHKLSSINNK